MHKLKSKGTHQTVKMKEKDNCCQKDILKEKWNYLINKIKYQKINKHRARDLG